MAGKPVIPDWVKVGAEMVQVSRSWGPFPNYGRTRRITKVYASGRFVLEGSDQQYRPETSSTRASATGRFSSSTLELLTDAVRDDMAQAEAYRSALHVVRAELTRLEGLRSVGDILAEAARINKTKGAA